MNKQAETAIASDIRFRAKTPSQELTELIVNIGAQKLWKAFHKFCASTSVVLKVQSAYKTFFTIAQSKFPD